MMLRSSVSPATSTTPAAATTARDRSGSQSSLDHRTSSRLSVLVIGGVAGLLVAIIAGRPLLTIVAAAPLLLAVAGSLLHRWPDLAATIDSPDRAVEGDQVDLLVRVTSAVGIPWLQVDIQLPADMQPVDGIRQAIVSVPPGGRTTVPFPVTLARWGVATPGRVEFVARGPFGLFLSSTVLQPRAPIRIHPRDGNRPSVVVPERLRMRVGAHRSNRHGDGSDFAEVRPFRTGDSLRSVNWRVSARQRERWVTVRHPDQAGDLVFLLDSFRDVGPEDNRLVQRAVRAAMSLADSNLGVHDRVGLLDVGLRIRWYRPGQGRLQKARLLDALLESQAEPGLSLPKIDQLPLHELGADAMVVMLTGLTDPDMSLLPIELKLRGLQVAVIECLADDHIAPPEDQATELAIRLWRVQRAARRKQLVDHGVPVMPWSADQPIELPVAALAKQRPGPGAGAATGWAP
ncbi:MAG: DUF58 domain-containing protein [Actinomycetota bacterium]